MKKMLGYFSTDPIPEEMNDDDVKSIESSDNDETVDVQQLCNARYEISILTRMNTDLINNHIELIHKFQKYGFISISFLACVCGISIFSDDLAIVAWLISTAGLLSIIPGETLFGGQYLGTNYERLVESCEKYKKCKDYSEETIKEE